MQLEDEEGQRLADEFNSPKANRDEAKGSEEKPVGTPRALHPQPPAQEITQETQVTADSPAAAASIVPAGHLGTQLAVLSAAAEAPSDSQRALAPAVMEIVEASGSKKDSVVTNGPLAAEKCFWTRTTSSSCICHSCISCWNLAPAAAL